MSAAVGGIGKPRPSRLCSVCFIFVRQVAAQLEALVRDVEHLLASLAIYVEQARRDEVDRVTDQSRSLADDIRLIEEQGIYHLLCSLHLGTARPGKPAA